MKRAFLIILLVIFSTGFAIAQNKGDVWTSMGKNVPAKWAPKDTTKVATVQADSLAAHLIRLCKLDTAMVNIRNNIITINTVNSAQAESLAAHLQRIATLEGAGPAGGDKIKAGYAIVLSKVDDSTVVTVDTSKIYVLTAQQIVTLLNNAAGLDSGSAKIGGFSTDNINPIYLFNISATVGRKAIYLSQTSLGASTVDGITVSTSKPITGINIVAGEVVSIDTPSTVASGIYTNTDQTLYRGVATAASNGLSGGTGGGSGFDNSFDLQFAGNATTVSKVQSGFKSYDQWFIGAYTDSVGNTIMTDSLCAYPENGTITIKRGTINTSDAWVAVGRIAGNLACPTNVNATSLSETSIRVTWANPVASLTSTIRNWQYNCVSYATDTFQTTPTTDTVRTHRDSTGVTITGLTGSTKYFLNVFSLTSKAELSANQDGSRDTCTTGGAAPEADAIAPDSISGLIAWYEARFITGSGDSTNFGTWVDHTSNSYNLTTHPSAYNPLYLATRDGGKPTVKFETGNYHLMRNTNVGTVLNGAKPLTFVIRYYVAGTGAQQLCVLGSSSDGDMYQKAMVHTLAGLNFTTRRAGGGTQITTEAGQADSWASWHTMIVSYDTLGNDTMRIRIDSTHIAEEDTLDNYQGVNYSGLSVDNLYVGGGTYDNAPIEPLVGYITFVYVYDRRLTLAEENYILRKTKAYYGAQW